MYFYYEYALKFGIGFTINYKKSNIGSSTYKVLYSKSLDINIILSGCLSDLSVNSQCFLSASMDGLIENYEWKIRNVKKSRCSIY
jgi:hypothetical protein